MFPLIQCFDIDSNIMCNLFLRQTIPRPTFQQDKSIRFKPTLIFTFRQTNSPPDNFKQPAGAERSKNADRLW